MPPLVPSLNALLNSTSALLIATGWFAIQQGKTQVHKRCMISALVTSSLFLVSYLTYHAQVGSVHFELKGINVNWAGLGNSFQLFVAYFVLAVVVIVFAVRRARPGWAKWAAGLGTFSVFWGLTLIDDIMGAREHKALCEKDAGMKIYKQVKLPPEFYHPDGRPKFIEENGEIYRPGVTGHVKFESRDVDSFSSRYLKIDKNVDVILDARTGEVVAEKINFRRWPSPFVPSILHGKAIRCEGSTHAMMESYWQFYRQVFPNRTPE